MPDFLPRHDTELLCTWHLSGWNTRPYTLLISSARSPLWLTRFPTCLSWPSKRNEQAFQNFVDARLQPESDDLDIVFFDASITAKRNRSMRSFIKKDANFLR